MKQTISHALIPVLILVLTLNFLPESHASAYSTEVFINEIHYDNIGTDVGEAIEIAGPAFFDLTGYKLVLYAGSSGVIYGTTTLIGAIPDSGCGIGVFVVNFPTNGLHNEKTGVALLTPSDMVVQFLSYEGTFTADIGTSTDIGVSEDNSTAIGNSLQLTGYGTSYEDFTWVADVPNTFGAVNTDQVFCFHSISGNTGVMGVMLSYHDDVDRSVTSVEGGGYSLPVSYHWSGSVTPSKTGFTFTPQYHDYADVTSDQLDQDFIACPQYHTNLPLILR